MSEPVRLVPGAPAAELVLHRPDKRNAVSDAMWAAIPGLVARAEADAGSKVLILHGGEAGAFAAGADISEFDTVYADDHKAAAAGARIAAALDAIERCEKPVLAAIDGACVGAGVSLAMAADIRIASPGAKFGITPARLGLVYPAGDLRRLLAAIGPGAAKDILFTGRILPATEAREMRLIDRVCDGENALPAARALAEEIASRSQYSARAIKRMIAGLQSGWREDGPEALALFLGGFSGEDFAEGRAAFLEKRQPAFKVE